MGQDPASRVTLASALVLLVEAEVQLAEQHLKRMLSLTETLRLK